MATSGGSSLLPPSPQQRTSRTEVSDNEHWIRLSLGNNIHGTQSVRDVLQNDLKIPNDGKLVHSWLATAKQNGKCNIQRFMWEHLLGACNGGCTRHCNRETNLDELDITSLITIFKNAEHIIPFHILSHDNVINIKLIYEPHIESIKSTRNDLAHYSFKEKMPKPEFDALWIKIRSTLMAMGYMELKLFDYLKICSLDPHLEDKVKVIVDTFKVLDDGKCNKKEFEDFKSLVCSQIKKYKRINSKNKIELLGKLECVEDKMEDYIKKQELINTNVDNRLTGLEQKIHHPNRDPKEMTFNSKNKRIQLVRLSPEKCIISIEKSEFDTLKTPQLFVSTSNGRDQILFQQITSFIEDSVKYFSLRVNLESQFEYHFIIGDEESNENFSSKTFVLKDGDSAMTLSLTNSVFISGFNDGTIESVHYFEMEDELSKSGHKLNFNRHMVQAKEIFINNIEEFRERARNYIEINRFDTCFLPEDLIKDSTTKSFVQNLLPKESNQKALVGYNYINHLKLFGFNKTRLETLCIEDHGDHENTVLVLDSKIKMFYYIRISAMEKFKYDQIAKEVNRCNDFLKSFVLLHEAKLQNEDLAVSAMLALPNVSSSDINNAHCEISNTLQHFIILKDDADRRCKLKGKLNKIYHDVKKGRRNRGVVSQRQTSIPSKLPQILSESMATMVLVNTALPRLSNDKYQQVTSLLLNKEQYEVIHHPDNHIIITGGYGCGKSLILLEIAKELFLNEENVEIYYICFDSYSVLPARVKSYFQELVKEYPERAHIKLNALGINQSDNELGENKRHLPSVIEFYTKQSHTAHHTAHFLIDEVDGQMFTEEYSESVKRAWQIDNMKKSKIVFAMQSMKKQRNDVDESHCLVKTGMTLLDLKTSMRMVGNIFKLEQIATKCILQPTTIMIKRQTDTEAPRKPPYEMKGSRSPLQVKKVKHESQENEKGGIPESKTVSTDHASKQYVKLGRQEEPSINDVDLATFKSISPESFTNNDTVPSSMIETKFTYPKSENGVNIMGEKLPKIIYLNESFDLSKGKSGVILKGIFQDLLSDGFKTCVICNTQEEALLTRYSLEMNTNEDVQYYTPCIEVRLPSDDEKQSIWDKIQTSSSVLITNPKGFRGCEAESIVTFVNQDDDYNNHVLLEILTRAVVHLNLLVLPCKSSTNTDIKPGSLRHVIQLWKEEQAVSVMNVKSEDYSMEGYPTDYEEFKKKHENHPKPEDIKHFMKMIGLRKWDGRIYREIIWKGETYTFDDVYRMLRYERFDDVKEIIDENEFILDSLRGDNYDRTLLMEVAMFSQVRLFNFLVKFPQDFNIVDEDEMNITHYIVWWNDVDDDHVKMFEMLMEQITKDTFHRLINSLDVNGNSPLHLVAWWNHHNTMKLLIKNGANVNVRNKKGELPEEGKYCRDETKRLIRSYRN